MSTSTQAQADQRSDWEGLERSPEFRIGWSSWAYLLALSLIVNAEGER